MRRHVFTVSVVLWLIFAGAGEGQERTQALAIEPHAFKASNGQTVDAEFGRLSVPESRQGDRSKRIELAFVRFKSTSPNSGPPVVYLAGGPGGSGIATAQGSRFPVFMALRAAGDVIALDQRGTGRSRPNLACIGERVFPTRHT